MNVQVHNVNTGEALATPAAPASSDIVTDSAGRRLKIRQLNFLEESRLVNIMGESALNSAYMSGYVLPVAMVAEIDGEDCPVPNTVREVEVAIKRVDRHGAAAVLAYLMASADGQKENADATKKSVVTPNSNKSPG